MTHPAHHPGRRRCLALLLATVLPALATTRRALPPEVAAELPGAQLRGHGTLRFLGLHVYDARLWAPAAPGAEPAEQPLALEIEYARTLPGARIAERSIAEMRRVGEFDAAQAQRWHDELRRLLPDVQRGDRLTGVQRPGAATLLFMNGRRLGMVADAEFTRLFFGVWLSPRTSEPALRARLLGAEGGG